MGLESSWSLVDIPLDARDAAQAAARREGLSLGEWLTRRILKRYSELNLQERDEAFNQLANRITELAKRLDKFEDRFRAERLRDAMKYLHQGLERLTQDLVQATGHSAIQLCAVTSKLEEVIERLDELRAQMSRNSDGFDERVSDVRSALYTLTSRQHETADLFHARLEDLTQTVGDAWTRTSGNAAAFELQKTHIEQGFQTLEERLEESGRNLDVRFQNFSGRLDEIRAESAQGLAEVRQREAATSSAILDLQGRTSDLKSRFAEHASDDRYVALEHGLSELLNRTGATESGLASLHANTATVDDLLKTLTERLETHARDQEGALTELKASLSGQTSQAPSEGIDTESRMQQDILAELKASLLDLTSQALGERLAEESRKPQDALAELKTSLFDQLSRMIDDRLDAGERKQIESLQQLHADLVAEALKSFGEKLDAESVKQRQAIAELRATFAPQPASVPEAPQAETAEHDAPVQDVPVHAMSRHDTPLAELADHEIEGTLPPVIAPQPHDEVLELDAPLTLAASEAAPLHDELHVTEETEPAPVEPVFATSAAPVLAFAHNEASAHTAANTAAFLSAARQSLHDAARSPDTGSKTGEYFGLPFVRSDAADNKGKGETTSYALLAGVVLLAIIAIAVAAGELIIRSGPSPAIHTPRAAASSARSAPVIRHATNVASVVTAKVVPAAADKPVPQANTGDATRQLAMLANAGDSQAQMLLGLQQLNGPNKANAMNLLQHAADSGEPVAQYRLGTLFAEARGLANGTAKAFHWYSVAAQNGNRKAMSNLALAYAQGAGTTKNPIEAARWFSKAAQLGLVDAQFDLAVLYERGLGVPQSLMDAYRWYLIAAKSGDRESKDRVEALASQLSPEDRSAAETAAAQFRPQLMNARANEPQ